MKRNESATILAIALLQGKALTRQEIMEMTGFNADVTHLLLAVRNWNLPVESVAKQPASESFWFIPADAINEYYTNRDGFIEKQLKATKGKKKQIAARKVKRIATTFGNAFVQKHLEK